MVRSRNSYNNGTLTVNDSSGHTAKLSFSGSYSLGNFKFASDGKGGTIVYHPPVADPSQKTPVAVYVALGVAGSQFQGRQPGGRDLLSFSKHA